MNGPNLLTLLRIFFVPLLVAALLGGAFVEPYLAALTGPLAITRETFALIIFLAAGATDFVASVVGTRDERERTFALLSAIARSS